MKFKPGDKVSFLNEKGHGIVTKILGDGNIMVEVGGVEIPYPAGQLVYFDPPLKNYEQKDTPASSEKLIKQKINYNNKGVKAQKHTNKEYWEVDLHIGELVDSYKHLTNSQMLVIQMDHCRIMLERARTAKVKKVFFIHGVGNGVLKNEVRKFLDSQQGISYYDAPYRMFGFGATEVNIR